MIRMVAVREGRPVDEAEWRAASTELRRVFGRQMTPADRSEFVDVFVPVGRIGVELVVGVDESHVSSEQLDSLYRLQDAMAERVDGETEIVGVFISAEQIPNPTLASALGRMDGNEVIPLTLSQAQQLASLDVDPFDVLEPIHELVEVAASRPDDDLVNAAGGLLDNIAALLERYGVFD